MNEPPSPSELAAGERAYHPAVFQKMTLRDFDNERGTRKKHKDIENGLRPKNRGKPHETFRHRRHPKPSNR
jgi:hypothetical protein